ncbi:helix-turn-helix transcriptional regulator [Nocardia cyriacigeorgica]|uniref:Helix-turn-helix transcriptional regulator n=1 Tax=Nocardia cyriacigeorgica TaxID=135487 RepID=A0ABX0CUM2_9NOCA|nr:helix-turn-helix transcriptional regulator [Nocardia cyriacigeorgica]NEW39596.1 helix-turn-helix transcriptional regulator [Nocardia cyriacigeorgica]NEW57269.1 helix-turn-helix transcriptional regulator [Nocardia cyriacigeorgica]
MSADTGRLIKQLRSAKGWSQGKLAGELSRSSGYDMTREYISRHWESGRTEPSPFWLRHLAAALACPQGLLETDVKRREFLSHLAATSIAPVVASELLSQGFSTRLYSSGPNVDEWQATLAQYGADYMSQGAAQIQQRLAADLVVLQQQLDSPRMWAIAARLMTLYAKTYPGSDGNKAISWYRMAAGAADRSGDTDIRIWVRGRAAIALGYEGAALPVAHTFADQALAISDRHSLGRLNSIWGKAHAAAMQGDQSTARGLIDSGRREFDLSYSEEQTSDYAVPWWRVNVFLSLLAARLGDEKSALEAQDDARAALPPELPRFATHFDMHRGLMLVRAGDRAEGVRIARSALDALPPEKHALTLRMLMDEIRGPDRTCSTAP